VCLDAANTRRSRETPAELQKVAMFGRGPGGLAIDEQDIEIPEHGLI
jgi:hypothetical protein